MTDVSPIKKIKRKARFALRRMIYQRDYNRLKPLKDSHKGQRCFILGGGPSIATQNLSPLKDEFVCTVNASLKAIGETIPTVSMHVTLDGNRYRRFAGVFEDIAQRYDVPYRFYGFGVRRTWDRLEKKASKPYFVMNRPGEFMEVDMPDDIIKQGVHSCSSVLISAVQICDWLGFEEIVILGCDLNYDAAEVPYFYKMDALDVVHEADGNVKKRRSEMHRVNAEFDRLAKLLASRGTKVVNGGAGGNLQSLERVDFDSLFRTDTLS